MSAESGDKVAPASAEAAGAGSEPQFTFEDELYRDNPFEEQGDPSMYTVESKRARRKLREDPEVIQNIQKFWQLLDKDSDGKLTEQGYSDLYVRICKVIRPTFELEQAQKEVSVDFKRDARGAKSLTYEVFFDSMFELVDIWTVDIRSKSYTTFLHHLFIRMTIANRTDTATGETTQTSPQAQVEDELKRKIDADNAVSTDAKASSDASGKPEPGKIGVDSAAEKSSAGDTTPADAESKTVEQGARGDKAAADKGGEAPEGAEPDSNGGDGPSAVEEKPTELDPKSGSTVTSEIEKDGPAEEKSETKSGDQSKPDDNSSSGDKPKPEEKAKPEESKGEVVTYGLAPIETVVRMNPDNPEKPVSPEVKAAKSFTSPPDANPQPEKSEGAVKSSADGKLDKNEPTVAPVADSQTTKADAKALGQDGTTESDKISPFLKKKSGKPNDPVPVEQDPAKSSKSETKGRSFAKLRPAGTASKTANYYIEALGGPRSKERKGSQLLRSPRPSSGPVSVDGGEKKGASITLEPKKPLPFEIPKASLKSEGKGNKDDASEPARAGFLNLTTGKELPTRLLIVGPAGMGLAAVAAKVAGAGNVERFSTSTGDDTGSPAEQFQSWAKSDAVASRGGLIDSDALSNEALRTALGAKGWTPQAVVCIGRTDAKKSADSKQKSVDGIILDLETSGQARVIRMTCLGKLDDTYAESICEMLGFSIAKPSAVSAVTSKTDDTKTDESLAGPSLSYAGKPYCPVSLVNGGALVPGDSAVGSVNIGGSRYVCCDAQAAEVASRDPGRYDVDALASVGVGPYLPAARVLVSGPPGSGQAIAAAEISRVLRRAYGANAAPVVSVREAITEPMRRVAAKVTQELRDSSEQGDADRGFDSSLIADFASGSVALDDVVLEALRGAFAARAKSEDAGGPSQDGEADASNDSAGGALSPGTERLSSEIATAASGVCAALDGKRGWVAVLDVSVAAVAKALDESLVQKVDGGLAHVVVPVTAAAPAGVDRFVKERESALLKRVPEVVKTWETKRDAAWARIRSGAVAENAAETIQTEFKNEGLEVDADIASSLAALLSGSEDQPDDEEAKTLSAVQRRLRAVQKERALLQSLSSAFTAERESKARARAKSGAEEAVKAGEAAAPSIAQKLAAFPTSVAIDGASEDRKIRSQAAAIAGALIAARRCGFSKPRALDLSGAQALVASGKGRALPADESCPVARVRKPGMGAVRGSHAVAWRRFVMLCESKDAQQALMRDIGRYVCDGDLNADTKSSAEPRMAHSCIVLGGPRSGRARVTADLARTFQLERLEMSSMIDRLRGASLEGGAPAAVTVSRSKLERGEELNDEDNAAVVAFFTRLPRAQSRGWVLEGYPRTLTQAELLEKAGVGANQVIFIAAKKDALLKRIMAALADPADGAKRTAESADLVKYFEQVVNIRQQFEQAYDNTETIDGTLSGWGVSGQAQRKVLEGLARRRAAARAMASGRPARVYGLGLSRSRLMSLLNDAFGRYCPVSWVEERALRARSGGIRNMVLYRGSVYCLSDEKRLQRFEADAERFLKTTPSGFPTDLPQRLPYMLFHSVAVENCALGGYDPVVYVRGSRKGVQEWIEGDPRLCAAYRGRVYRFSTPATLEEFMTFPAEYTAISLRSQPDKTTADQYLKLGNYLKYIEKSCAVSLTDALASMESVRPKYPAATFEVSTQVYLSLYLKANNKKVSQDERAKYASRLQSYLDDCALVENLARALSQQDNAAGSAVRKQCERYDELAKHSDYRDAEQILAHFSRYLR